VTVICKEELFIYVMSLKLESFSQRKTISATLTANVRKFLAECYSTCEQFILDEESANVL